MVKNLPHNFSLNILKLFLHMTIVAEDFKINNFLTVKFKDGTNLNESQSSTNVKMNIKKLYSIDIPYYHSQIKEIMEHIFSLRSENS